jgi:capsular polysaccharide biosynthesis protein
MILLILQLSLVFKAQFGTLMKEIIMIYILLLGFVVVIFSLMLSSFFSSKSWESDGRMINADWMATEEKFHFIARWGA